MRPNFPRCNLPSNRQRANGRQLVLPPPKRALHACELCGEDSAYCTHPRKNGQHLCENCYRKSNVILITKKKQWLWDHKESEGCLTCKERDPSCLDYHHLHKEKKKFSIGSVPSSIPTEAIKIEMRKCVVLCANCHRKVEAAQSIGT